MLAVVDPNIIISALLSPSGAPAQVLIAWQEGKFDLIVSPQLVSELERALSYPKLRKRINADEATQAIEWLSRSAMVVSDPDEISIEKSPDPGDDYLLALVVDQRAVLVSGDKHLLGMSSRYPIFSAAAFLELLDE